MDARLRASTFGCPPPYSEIQTNCGQSVRVIFSPAKLYLQCCNLDGHRRLYKMVLSISVKAMEVIIDNRTIHNEDYCTMNTEREKI